MRRLLILLAVVAAFAGGGSYVAWQWAVGQMRARLDAWTVALRREGWSVSHGPPVAGGWPFAAELAVPDLSFGGLADVVPGGASWRAARVMLRVSAVQPSLLSMRVVGSQRLSLGPDAALTCAADHVTLTLPLADAAEVALDAGGMSCDDGVSVGLLQGQIEPAAAGTRFRLSAEAIALPPPPPPLGGHIASASVEGVLTGALPVSVADARAAAATWQASGGAVRVQRMALGWGPLGASGDGELALDSALQPAGTARLHLVGFAEAVRALADGHVVSAHAAQAAGAVLMLMATTPEGGGAAAVDVPLSLRDRTLSMGHIPLARLPELFWQPASGPGRLAP